MLFRLRCVMQRLRSRQNITERNKCITWQDQEQKWLKQNVTFTETRSRVLLQFNKALKTILRNRTPYNMVWNTGFFLVLKLLILQCPLFWNRKEYSCAFLRVWKGFINPKFLQFPVSIQSPWTNTNSTKTGTARSSCACIRSSRNWFLSLRSGVFVREDCEQRKTACLLKIKKKRKEKMENSFVYCFSGDETRYNILAEPLWIQAVLSLSDPITAEEAWPTFLRPVKLICAMSKICQDGSNIVAGEAVKLTHDHGLAQSVLFILSPETEDKKKFLAKLMPGSLQTHHSL